MTRSTSDNLTWYQNRSPEFKLSFYNSPHSSIVSVIHLTFQLNMPRHVLDGRVSPHVRGVLKY